jgi:hypothetical protein
VSQALSAKWNKHILVAVKLSPGGLGGQVKKPPCQQWESCWFHFLDAETHPGPRIDYTALAGAKTLSFFFFFF